MKTILCILVATFAVGVSAAAAPSSKANPLDVESLSEVQLFAFGPVGFSGDTSQGEAAFARILKTRHALQSFLTVFDRGGLHSRCYALVALRELSPKHFHEKIALMRKTHPGTVMMMSGCELFEVDSSTVLSLIESGAYAVQFKLHARKG